MRGVPPTQRFLTLWNDDGARTRTAYNLKAIMSFLQSLKAAQGANLLSIIDAFADGILVVESDGKICGFNKRCEELFGWTAPDMLGQPVNRLIPWPIPEHKDVLDTIGKRSDDSVFAVEIAVGAFPTADGETLSLVAIRDTTEHDSTEQLQGEIAELRESRESVARQREEMAQLARDLADARDKAEQANRDKSEFLAVMSHELRTPLNGLLGISMLMSEADLPREQRKQLEMIEQAGESLLVIVNDLLDISKIETGHLEIEPEDLDLHQLIESICAVWELRADEKGLDFILKRADDLPRFVRADATRLRQIVDNFLNNATKFTKSGEITLTVNHITSADGKVELGIDVTDTGLGIKNKYHDRLFKRFSQADRSMSREHGGTGLGLAICKQLAELMDGEVGFVSEFGKGSTFWLCVPCRIGDERLVAGGRDLSVIDDFNRILDGRVLDILLVEDSKINRAVVEGLFARGPHRIETAVDGRDGVDKVRDKRFDVVLMDHQMPVMDGVEATETIRALDEPCASVPIIALTANAMAEHRSRYQKAGMNDYVAKPINPGALFDAIARCVLDEAPTERLADKSSLRDSQSVEPQPHAKDALKKLESELDDVLAGLDLLT